jgi:hypothetical protein
MNAPLPPSNFSSSSRSSNADRALKVLGLVLAIWIAARVIGWLFSPGLLLLAIAIWLIVRSQRNRKQPVAFVPAPMMPLAGPLAGPPAGPLASPMSGPVAGPVYWQGAPVPPKGYWMPTAPVAMAPMPYPAHPYPAHPYAPTPYAPNQYAPTQYAPAQQVVPAGWTPPAGQPVATFDDPRTPAEREIEEYVERSWPNV